MAYSWLAVRANRPQPYRFEQVERRQMTITPRGPVATMPPVYQPRQAPALQDSPSTPNTDDLMQQLREAQRQATQATTNSLHVENEEHEQRIKLIRTEQEVQDKMNKMEDEARTVVTHAAAARADTNFPNNLGPSNPPGSRIDVDEEESCVEFLPVYAA